jgi:hypothetical protein
MTLRKHTPSRVLWKDHIHRGLNFGFERKSHLRAVLIRNQLPPVSPEISEKFDEVAPIFSSLSSLLRAFGWRPPEDR